MFSQKHTRNLGYRQVYANAQVTMAAKLISTINFLPFKGCADGGKIDTAHEIYST